MNAKTIAILILALAALALAGCGGGDEESAPDHTDAAAQTSLFLLDGDWTDQTGAVRVLEDFRGKLIVTAMMFTNCSYACPRIVADLQGIEAAIPAGNRDDVQFLLVSMDSDRDTPEVLEAFANEKGLDPKHWTLLHGDEFEVRGVGAALGVRFKRGIKGDFAHSNIITVLDREGRQVFQLEGLNADAAPVVATIRERLPRAKSK